jgi:hypothetical protein
VDETGLELRPMASCDIFIVKPSGCVEGILITQSVVSIVCTTWLFEKKEI